MIENYILTIRFLLFLGVGFLIGISFANCRTVEIKPNAEKPTDYTELIEETRKDIASNPSYYPDNTRIQKVLLSLDDCNTKSLKLYSEYEKELKHNEESKQIIIEKNQRIESLKSELETWETIKTWFYSIIVLILIGCIFSIAWKFRKLIYPAFPI